MKLWRVILFLFAAALGAEAQNYAVNGSCTLGGQATITQGVASSGTRPLKGQTTFTGTGVMASYPGCTVTVYSTGTTVPATIYLTATGSAQSNPFTANLTDGSFVFFAPAGCYDIMISSGATQASTMPNAKTFPGVCAGNTGGGGGGGGTTAGTQVTVNGTAAVPNSLNFSNVLLPPSNGSLINFLLSGNTVGAYLAGNGNASNCLSGTGTWVACSGGGGGGTGTLPTTPLWDLFASTGAGAAQASGIFGGGGFLMPQVVAATGDVTSSPPPTGLNLQPNASVEYFPSGYAWSGGTSGAAHGLAMYMSHSAAASSAGNGGIALGGGNSSGAGNQVYLDCEMAGCDFKVPVTENGSSIGGGGGGGSLPTTPAWDLFASTGAGGAQASGVLGQGGFLRAYVLEATGTGNASPFTVPNGSIEYFPTGGYGAGGVNGVALHVSHSGSATGFGGIALAGGNTSGTDQLYLDCEGPPVVPALGCDFKVPVTYLGSGLGGGGTGSGTVASGTAGHFTWYAATGTTVTSNAHLDDSVTTPATITSQETIAAPGINVTGSGGISMTGTGGTLPTPVANQGGIGIGPGNVPEYYTDGGAWTAISSGGGAQGPPGAPGAAATITVGTTTTGAAGSNAAVTNSGTSSAAVFNFTVPQGAAGATGATGPTGPTGSTGATGPTGAAGTAASVTVGTTNTLPAGSVATVTNSGTAAAAVLNFGIPEGQPGSAASGISGATTGGGLVVSGTTTQTLGLVTSCTTGQVLQWNGTSWVCAAPGGVTNPISFPAGTPAVTASQGGFGVIAGALPAISQNGAAFSAIKLPQVNAAALSASQQYFNLNDSSPAAQANGLNIKWQLSGSAISAYLLGDGISTHCLSGIATWIPCSAGTTVQVGGTSVGATANFNNSTTTPPLPTNGHIVNFQNSGSSITAALVGDGSANDCLKGDGTFGPCIGSAGTPIQRGAQAPICQNDSSQGASPWPMAIPVTINAGDLVVVLVANYAAGAFTVTDNGAGAGNTYTQQVTTTGGASQFWIFTSPVGTTTAANTVTVTRTSAGTTKFSACLVTYTGVTAIGAPVTNTGTGSPIQTVSTTVATTGNFLVGVSGTGSSATSTYVAPPVGQSLGSIASTTPSAISMGTCEVIAMGPGPLTCVTQTTGSMSNWGMAGLELVSGGRVGPGAVLPGVPNQVAVYGNNSSSLMGTPSLTTDGNTITANATISLAGSRIICPSVSPTGNITNGTFGFGCVGATLNPGIAFNGSASAYRLAAANSINSTWATSNQSNFNDTTPAAQTYGKNISWQVNGANISAYLPGDGSTNCLSGLGTYVACGGGGTGGITGATANGGLVATGGTLGMLTSCTANQVLRWSGTAWACYTPTTGTVTGATASGGLVLSGSTLGLTTTCAANQYLAWVSSAWTCTTPTGGGGGSGTVNSGTAGQFAYYSATGTAVSGAAALTTDGTNITATQPVIVPKLTGNGMISDGTTTPNLTAPPAQFGFMSTGNYPGISYNGSGGALRAITVTNVNGTAISTNLVNWSGTNASPAVCTAATPTNGKCLTYLASGSNISTFLVGDGSTNCLNGQGNYVPCSGGGATAVQCMPTADLLSFTTATNVCVLNFPAGAKQWIVECNLIWNRQSTGQSAASTMTAVLTLSVAPTAASYFTTETWASGGPVFGNVNVLTTPLATTFNTASSAQGDTTIWSYVYHGTLMVPAGGMTATFTMAASNGTGLIRLGSFCKAQ